MGSADAEGWVSDISEEAPAGENLEFDGDFGALERSAQGKPEQQFGDVIVPGEDPDWKEVANLAIDLIGRTKDLRVFSLLAVAKLQTVGLGGMVDVLGAIRQLLETRWEQVHPQLDPEDDNDPTLRANALLQLTEPRRVLRVLRDMPLAASPRIGRISWRDISIAIGAIEGEPDKEKPSEAIVRGAFNETDPARLAALRETVAVAADHFNGIPAAFDTNAGYGTGPDFDEIIKLLKEIGRFMERFAPEAGAEAAPEMALEGTAEAAPPEGGQSFGGAAPARGSGAITAKSLTSVLTRSDALHLLGLVCQYYEQYEPSSPLQLLVDRARRLADKNFIDLIRDLAPDGLQQARTVTGVNDD